MLFRSPLVEGRLVRRYKRFLADVTLADGAMVTAHCANSGAMMGLLQVGSRVLLAPAANPKAKLPYSWEIIEAMLPDGPQLVGINTANPNRIVEAALRRGAILELSDYAEIRREVAYGAASRVDFLLTAPDRPPCFLEVKNCHLMRIKGLAEFPDSVTERGAKHLAELGRERAAGNRAVMLYVIQMRAEAFALASDLDPGYAAAFAAARSAGVEAFAYTCRVASEGITLDRRVPILDGGARGR